MKIKKSMKKVLTVLLCICVLLQYIPMAALAADGEILCEHTEHAEDCPDCAAGELPEEEVPASEETAVDTVTVYASPETDLPDSDELFAYYADSVLYGYEMSTFGTRAREGLDSVSQAIYDVLKGKIESVAANGGSTVFTVSGISGMKLTWTNTELGVSSIDNTAAVEAAFASQFDFHGIISALLSDCPFDLYWYDKTVENAATMSYQIGRSGAGGVWTEAVITDLTFSFTVVTGYRGGDANTVASEVKRVTDACTAIQSVINANNGKSDYEKMLAYKEYICGAVSYNDEAAADDYTGGYGDPWQLIYVFDGDDSTEVVCEGYSKAFQHLCDLGGLDCISVSGYMTGGTGAGPHMWNIVTLDGENYLVDVTNCDAGTVGEPDGLFLLGGIYTNGGYTYTVGGQTITYTCADQNLAAEDYEPPVPYKINAYTNSSEYGTVTAPSSAKEGETVVVTTKANVGYRLTSITVKDSGGNSVDVSDNTFTMPASDVTVSAKFLICNHTGLGNGYADDNGNGTHSFTCPVCQLAVTEEHSVSSENGECIDCGVFAAAASVTMDGETEYFVSLYYAVNAAELRSSEVNPATVTMLADWDESVVIDEGVIIFDLNGKTLESSGVTLEIMSGNVTVCDSAGGGKVISTDDTALYAFTSITVTGGSYEGKEYDIQTSSLSFLTVAEGKSEGAAFPGGIQCNTSLAGVLANEMAFWKDGKQVVLEEDQTAIDGTVTVKRGCLHPADKQTYTDLGSGKHAAVCGVCGYETEQEHTTIKEASCSSKAVCARCGEYGEISKTNHDESVPYDNGFCTNCDAYEPAVLEDGVYKISNAGQLYWFAAKVKDGNSFINGELTENIVVNTGDVSGCEGTKAEGWREWTPIGYDGFISFDGTFNGNGKIVSGLYFNNSEGAYIGLFGYVDIYGTVKNVGVVNSYLRGEYKVGGVVGENNGTVTNCYNTGTISGTGNYVGGVVGYNYEATVTNCYNTGKISGSKYVGGVVGYNYGNGSNLVTNCYNTGDISGNSEVGGVVGYNYDKGTVKDCYNEGTISGNSKVGGVVGYNNGIGSTVTSCSNRGTVSSRDTVGGIVGYNEGSVTECHNEGAVSGVFDGGNYIGGVVGRNYSGSTVKDCYNTGTISGTGNYVGGVAGGNDSAVTDCYNTGAVNGGSNVGGVVGNNGSTVTNCYNAGAVSGVNAVGGVVGFNTFRSNPVTNCYYLYGTADGGINGADAEGKAEARTAEQFKSGEVAYLLQAGRTEDVWGQDIGTDDYPDLVSPRVYLVKNCKDEAAYSNTNEDIGHIYENCVCSVCGAVCDHSESKHDTLSDNGDGTHSYTCTVCGANASENHVFDSETHKCACGAGETFTVTVVCRSSDVTVSAANPVAEYGKDYVTALESEAPHIKYYYCAVGDSISWSGVFDGSTLTIPASLVTGNITVYVDPIVIVTVNANGGRFEDHVDSEDVTAEEIVLNIIYNAEYGGFEESLYDLYRKGYTTVSLNTKADGSGISYAMDASAVFTEDVTLYVQWEPYKYSVTWNVDGETYATTKQTYDAALKLPDEPEKAFHGFLGWFTAAEGGEQVTAETVFKNVGNGTVYYARFCDHSENTNKPVGEDLSGTHTVTCSVCGDVFEDSHEFVYTVSQDGTTATVTCSVCDAMLETVTLVAPECKVYGDGGSCEITGVLNGVNVGGIEGEIYYKWEDNKWNELEEAPADAGTYRAEAYNGKSTPADPSDDFMLYVEYTIEKADPVLTDPTPAEDLTYCGSAQKLVETEGSATGGSLVYRLKGEEEWSKDPCVAIDAGTYEVEYMVIGNENYNEIPLKSFTVTIDPCDLSKVNTEITLGQDSFVYDGDAKTPEITSVVANLPDADGIEYPVPVEKDTDYTATYEGSEGVGTAKVIITGKGNFTGTVTKTYEITCDHSCNENELEYKDAENHGYDCSVCDEEILSKHTGGTANCMSGAICDECKQAYGSKDAEKHTGVNHIENAKAADCKNDGYTGDMVCECGKTITEGEVISAGGHNYTAEVEGTRVPATCMAEGTVTMKCTACEDTEVQTLEIDPENHTGNSHTENAEDPTCAKEGYTGDTVCECGKKLKSGETISATGEHSYTVEVEGTRVPATCMAEGTVTMKCTACEDTEVQTLEIDPENHTGNNHTENAKDPTCAEEGYTGDMVCECGKKLKSGGTISATGEHSYTVEVEGTRVPATCMAEGTVTMKCATCEDTEVQTLEIDPENHTGNNTIVGKKDATCKEEGYTGDTICECGKTVVEGEVAEKLTTHTWGDWVVTKEATETETGTKVRTCSVCEKPEEETIPMIVKHEAKVEGGNGGKAEVDNPTPKAGDEVTVTVTPDEGKEIDGVVVKDENGEKVPVTDNGDGTYTYEQPDGDVTVEVTFKDKKAPVEPSGPNTGDKSNLALWIVLMVVSVMGAAATWLRKKRYI